MSGRPAAPWLAVALAVAALLSAAPGLGNGFVYDDVPIIVENPTVHALSLAPRVWTSGYWPSGLLYRPLAIQLFALEWAVGEGSPVVFHIVNTLLGLATALLFWRLARRLLPPWPAWVGAVFFAVHPVHVEVVGNAVGQTELLATALALLIVERYLAWRGTGPLTPPQRGALAILTLLAILSKETGYVIPALLLAVEFLIVRPGAGTSWRLRSVVPGLALQAVAVLGAVLLRIAVLGPTTAAGPSAVLRDLPATDRVIGMLAVVPEWARLLVWPAHLQAEYGPPALPVVGAIGAAHLLGALLLITTVALAAASWRRSPVLSLGLLWIGIALLPVSNLVTATGVVLAERTLFLPSAGAMLAIGAMLAPVFERAGRTRTMARRAVVAGVAVLALLGLARSMERQAAWRTPEEFANRLLRDGPTTYRAHLVASSYYAREGRVAEAERSARRGLALYQGDPQIYEHLGQLLRSAGRCLEALPLLTESVRKFPDQTIARSRLIECTLAVGDSTGALMLAAEAVSTGHGEFEQTVRRLSRPR
jgi:hypothetical protein